MLYEVITVAARFSLIERLRISVVIIKLIGIGVGFAAAGIVGDSSLGCERKRAFWRGDRVGAIAVVSRNNFV